MRVAIRSAALLAACVLGGGCLGGGRSDPSKLFTLTATAVSDGVPDGSWNTSIGLGPIAIPGYLDRPQLVTRVGPNELRLTESRSRSSSASPCGLASKPSRSTEAGVAALSRALGAPAREIAATVRAVAPSPPTSAPPRSRWSPCENPWCSRPGA